MTNKIIDIKYQEISDGEPDKINTEAKQFISDGFQPYYAPVFLSYETTFKVYYGMYQTWVKYES